MYAHGVPYPKKRNITYVDDPHIPADPDMPYDAYNGIADNGPQDHLMHHYHREPEFLTYRAGWKEFKMVYEATISNSEAKRIIDNMGWGDFFRISVPNSDLRFIEAMIERFWDTANSFQFPHIEIGFLPLDLTFLTGIPTGEGDLPPYDASWNTRYQEMMTTYFPHVWELVPSSHSRRGAGINNSVLKRYLIEASTRTTSIGEGKVMARAFIMWMIGQIFFPNSSSVAGSGWVAALIDLEKVKDYDWGSAILARLYHAMGESCRCVKSFDGCHMLLEYWFYAYFQTLLPNLKNQAGPADVFPLIKAYDKDARSHRQVETSRHSLTFTREQIGYRLVSNTIWQPYARSRHFRDNPVVRKAFEYSSQRIILYDPEKAVGSWYLGDRFWRQLYGEPTICVNPPLRESMSYIPSDQYLFYKQKGWDDGEKYIVRVKRDEDFCSWWKHVSNAPIVARYGRHRNKDVRGSGHGHDPHLHMPFPPRGTQWFDYPEPSDVVDTSPYCDWTMEVYNQGDGKRVKRPVTSVEPPTFFEPDRHTSGQWAKIASEVFDLNSQLRLMALEDSQRAYRKLKHKDRQIKQRDQLIEQQMRQLQKYRSMLSGSETENQPMQHSPSGSTESFFVSGSPSPPHEFVLALAHPPASWVPIPAPPLQMLSPLVKEEEEEEEEKPALLDDLVKDEEECAMKDIVKDEEEDVSLSD